MVARQRRPRSTPVTLEPKSSATTVADTEALKDQIYAPVAEELDQVVLNIASVPGARNEHAPEIEQRLAHVLSAPGKRVRPAVTLLASRLWGRQADERAINMATAVELLHIATLIHDDTVDSAATRRGQATASNLWGGTVAVLLGDYVFASSAMFVCETNSVRLIKRFAQTITELSRGELAETMDAWRPTVTREDYFRRIYDKTASLFSTAAESGAVLGEAGEEQVKLLRDYGYNLGMAYQVHDDLLDYEASADEMGKPVEHDLASGVLTLPAIVALEGGPARQLLLDYLGAPPHERSAMVSRTVSAIRSSAAFEEARAVSEDFTAKARAALAQAAGQSERAERTSLSLLTTYLRQRRS